MAYTPGILVGDTIKDGFNNRVDAVVTVISGSTDSTGKNSDVITTAAYSVTKPVGSISRESIGLNGKSVWVIGQ